MDNVASRPQPGLAPTAVSNESSTLLEVLVPQLWQRLDSWDFRALRICSREVLRLADRCTDTLKLKCASSEAERDGVVAALCRMLARGCRPRKLGLWFFRAELPATKIAFGLRLLAELQASSLPLTKLQLGGLPLTAAVVRAIVAAVPQASTLQLFGYSLLHCTGLPDSPRPNQDPSGVQALLRHAAPRLQKLRLYNTTGLAGTSMLPAAPNGLASLLLQCSRLESLRLSFPDNQEPLASYHGILSTRLCLSHLEVGGEFDLGDVLPALLGIRGLAALQLPSHQLQPSHMRQLAAFTALTLLGAQGIGAAGVPLPEGTEELGSLPAPAPQPLVPLPALLQELALVHAPSPSALTALQLPPGPLRLQLPGITVPAADKGADGCLRESAAEALLAACRQLAGRFCEDEDECSPFELDLCGAAPPPSWPDGYGTLFAAIRPVGIRRLAIQAVSLTLYDVDALVRHLPLLERLLGLELHPERGGLVGGWDNELALRAALLVLCAEAPSLADVTIFVEEDADEPLLEAALQVVDWLSQELPTLRDDPPSVHVE
ncbi:hypothetical protein TSOC_004081 [Tetrabaena socialis]|uniref:F-box domain-containing protein n=1 Tax=Tetrabaena socialis TaxID=47790 RepID=A0A2J8A9V8_9CHLO|nr:hypothetical protein TSOC_004081 [Tetrabaena socialis]|eukprot:PNH09300.1 hypothetical protein TSOC_004081 [Tetrabaena socialis]